MKLDHIITLRESLFAGAAYRDLETGEIYGPDGTHASVLWAASGHDSHKEDELFNRYANGNMIAGFLTTDGRFMDRVEAGRYSDMERDERRQKLDSDDPEFQNNVDNAYWGKPITESRKMAGAAMIDHKTGKIYGPGDNHYDVMTSREAIHDFASGFVNYDDPHDDPRWEKFENLMWKYMDTGRLEDGFVDDTGKWYNRTDAAKAVKLNPSKTDGDHNPNDPRTWLDAWDLRMGFDTIHESTNGYSAYELGEIGKHELLSHIPSVFHHVDADHVTYEFGVPEQLPPTASGAHVIAMVQSDSVQAAIVEINGTTRRPDGKIYHITISYDRAGGARAVDSNMAIANLEWTPVEPFDVPVSPAWFSNTQPVQERLGVPQSTSRTLYHGTTLDVAKAALQHGLYPSVGALVDEFYGDHMGDEKLEDLIFAANKASIGKCVSAMKYHVSKKLNISVWKLTSKQIYQNAAILVLRSGEEDFEHANKTEPMYHHHPTQVEPGDYYRRYSIKPDYILTGLKLKRFLIRLGLSLNQSHILHPDQQKNMLIKAGHIPKPVREDVETDLRQSQFLSRLVRLFRNKIRTHLQDTPIYNSDNQFMKLKSTRVVVFNGRNFDWPGRFKELFVILRGEDTEPTAGYHAYDHPDGTTERIISFAVLPPESNTATDSDRMNIALSRMMSERWAGIMLHELHHVSQGIQQLPMAGKGSFVNGKPTAHDYHNNPIEFDAYYHQLTSDYHALLGKLRANPQEGAHIAQYVGFNRDFRKSLDTMLPKHFGTPEWGMWYYARQQQNRRLTKRLYALHQAIVKELDHAMGIRESDDDHQTALNNTGFWGNAGAGCIIMAQDTKRFLIPKRSKWVQEPDTFGTWGGAIDKGEDPKTACLREVQEEAGYTGQIIGMEHLYQFRSNSFRYDTFLVIVENEFEPNLNWETSEAVWVKYGQWPQPLHFGIKAVLKDPSALNKLGAAASS